MYNTLWCLDYAHPIGLSQSKLGLYPSWIILLASPETDMDYNLVDCYQQRVATLFLSIKLKLEMVPDTGSTCFKSVGTQ